MADAPPDLPPTPPGGWTVSVLTASGHHGTLHRADDAHSAVEALWDVHYHRRTTDLPGGQAACAPAEYFITHRDQHNRIDWACLPVDGPAFYNDNLIAALVEDGRLEPDTASADLNTVHREWTRAHDNPTPR